MIQMAVPTLLPDTESAIEYAQYVLACSEQSPATFVTPTSSSSGRGKSIHQKLQDLYIEETLRQPENSKLVYASNLLAKLAKREKLYCLVLSLYPGNEGYTIMLPSRNGGESETMKLPYEESEILEYIDACQLPPFLIDLLEKAPVNIFYSGCVVVELRDYRRSTTGSYDSKYVLLRPSAQSILRDVTAMSCDGHSWTQDDLFHLESELILATEEPLCLDPSPAVMFVENALQYQKKFLNDPALKRSVKHYSQAAMNRKRKLAQSASPASMRLYDFLAKKKKSNSASSHLKTRQNIDSFKNKSQPVLATPESIDVKKYAKLPEIPPTSGMIFVEEHIMERDPKQDQHMMAKIMIYQPQLGDRYFGEFYLDHDYGQTRSGEEGRRCRFAIGSRQCVDRYLQQFKDLFTEEGKLQVRIAVRKANEQAPTITFTQGLTNTVPIVPNPNPTAITISSAQALMKQVAIGQQGIKGADVNAVGKRNIPIQLSLAINPQTANLATSQAATSIPSSMSAQFLASSVQGASVVAAQRLKGSTSGTTQHRPSSSPLSSPVQPPKASTPQQSAISAVPLIALPKAPTPTLTPPPNSRTPTPTLAGSRRSSAAELTQQVSTGNQQQQQQQQQQSLQQQNLAGFLQSFPSGTVVASTDNQSNTQSGQQNQAQQSGALTNISLGNLGNLSPNINLQGLAGIPGVNLTNISGLQQMQVSLAQIAVPVPITMINASANLIQTQQGILANSSSTAASNGATLVTMVTALPASSASTATSTTMTGSSQVAVSTGSSSNSTTVLPQSSGMLSFPVGLSGLTQLMPVNSKAQNSHGIRTPAAMPLLQLQGQQGIQLLSLQQRGQVKAGTPSSSAQNMTRLAQAGTPTVPLSTVLSSNMTTQLIQLTSGAGAALGTAGSQRPTHVAFGKGQQGLQFHSLQLKPGSSTLSQVQGSSKSKTSPRTNTTTYK